MEFPPPDPPPVNFGQPSFGAPAAPNFNLPVPSYHQMITTAILALNEKDGSSRQAISKYIENEFKNLPPTHSNDLTQELRRMKNNGHLVLVKHSYMLPGSLPYAVANGLVPQGEPQASDVPKRRPGRPPKLKHEIQTNGSSGVVSSAPPPPAAPQSFGFVVDAPPLVREQPYGVPTTNLFSGLNSGVQFTGPASNLPAMNPISPPGMNPISGPSNVATAFHQGSGMQFMGHVSNPPGMNPISGPSNVATNFHQGSGMHFTGPVSNPPAMNPISGPSNDATDYHQGSGVQFTGPVSSPLAMDPISGQSNFATDFHQGAPATMAPIEQKDGPPAKRRPGRPPKGGRPAVSVKPVEPVVVSLAGVEPISQTNDEPQMNDEPPQAASPVLGKRARARPAKFMLMSLPQRAGMNRGRGRPPSFARTGRRGRPRKLPVSTIKPTGRPRGRPRKNGAGSVVSVDGIGDGLVSSEAKKPRKLSGKPLGRPKKHAPVATVFASEQEETLAFEKLKERVEHLQSRIKQAVTVVKPYLHESAVIAIGALQDLEELASMDVINAQENVESAQLDDLNGVNVETAQVGDLNAPLDVQNAPANFQSAPFTAQNAHVFQSALVTFQSGQGPVQNQEPPSFRT